MKVVYASVGVVLILIIAGAYYFTSHTTSVETSLQNGETSPEDPPKETLELTSTAFKNGEVIPSRFTCDAEDVNPPLSISNIPEGTVSLVLIMDDPDLSKSLKPDGIFNHWVVYSLAPTTTEIPEATFTGNEGLNGAGKIGYMGPCPPTQYEPTEHRYFFKLYALSTEINFFKEPTKAEVEAAIQGYIIDSAELMGRYDRKR